MEVRVGRGEEEMYRDPDAVLGLRLYVQHTVYRDDVFLAFVSYDLSLLLASSLYFRAYQLERRDLPKYGSRRDRSVPKRQRGASPIKSFAART